MWFIVVNNCDSFKKYFCIVVAVCDLVHDMETIFHLC